jgi:RNA polymerase sigma-70 factor (ECF subfamily)
MAEPDWLAEGFERNRARLRAVNGAAGVVITLGGQPVAVMGFTVSGGKIAEIDVIIDPERLLRLGLPALDG